MRKRMPTAFSALLILACLAASPARVQQEARGPLKENRLLPTGAPAPDWTLLDAGGVKHTLSDYRGRVVVMDFWATWCKPCEKLMPQMQKLHERYAARGVTVFGVNSWEQNDPADLMRRKRLTYTLLLNGEGIAESYGVINLPVVYVIDASGAILYRHEGLGGDELSRVIEKHLKGRGM
jgi:thiol-disulfide isomerase/thioredoxin